MPGRGILQPRWNRIRADRRQRRAAGELTTVTAQRRAVLTIVHDEALLFPIWLGYYSRFFDADDIFVLDHDTADGSTDGTGFHRIRLHFDGIDTAWMTSQVQAMQHELLRSYDLVVTCDVDEFIAPDPGAGLGDLGQYLERFGEDFVNCYGVEVLHMPGEDPIDLDRPLLAQRTHWAHNPMYDKPAVSTQPTEWVLGFHRRTDGINNYDPDLFLIHLHRMDRDMCLDRHRLRVARRWSDVERREGRGQQNAIVDPVEFDRWFLHDSGIPERPLEPESYPKRWHRVL